MVPFYFGDCEKQLFGIYYTPKAHLSRKEGVLLCPPIAHEYIRTHMAIRQLALLLSAAGYHVLKFDYFAVGDSAGKSFEGSVAQWTEDIGHAYHELRDISGAGNISMVGVRIGAALVAEISTEVMGVKDIVFWDPVVNGQDYLNELKGISGFNDMPRISFEGKKIEEILGFPFSEEMINSIGKINLLENVIRISGNVYMVLSEKRREYFQLCEKIHLAGDKVRTTLIDEPAGWNSYVGHNEILVANSMINAIGELLIGRGGRD